MMYNTLGNRIKALYDIWVFADLINFKGGRKAFGTIHKKLVGFVAAPQLAKKCTSLSKSREKLEYSQRRLVLMPRGHLKSTVCSVLYVLWRMYRNPNIRILVGTNIKYLSQAFIRELRQYLEDPELQEEVWNNRPHVKGRMVPIMDAAGRKRRSQKADEEETQTEDKKLIWTLEALQLLRSETLKEPTVLATSYGTLVTGQHYDLLICDDIVDFRNSDNDEKKEKVITWAGDLDSVIDPSRQVFCGVHAKLNGAAISKTETVELWEEVGDEVVVLGTRYEDGDYYDYLMQNMKEFEYKVFTRNIYRNGQNWVKPCLTEEEYKQQRRNYVIGDDTGGYIWQERFNDDTIRRLKARLTPRRWASQYLNTIMNKGESLFDAEKIQYYQSARVKVEGGMVKVWVKDEEAPRVLRPVLTVDLASSMKATADNTVLTVGGVDEDNNLFVIDTKVGKFTTTRTVELFFELCEKWNITKAVVEVVGYQASFVQQLKEEFKNHRVVFVIEHRPQGEKKARLETGLQPYFESAKLFFPDWLAAHSVVQDEISMFPRSSAKDDFLDTLDIVRQYSQRVPRDMRKLLPKQPAYNRKYGGIR